MSDVAPNPLRRRASAGERAYVGKPKAELMPFSWPAACRGIMPVPQRTSRAGGPRGLSQPWAGVPPRSVENRTGHPCRSGAPALSSAAPTDSSAGRPRPPDGDAPKPFGGRERSEPPSAAPPEADGTRSASSLEPPRPAGTAIQRTTSPVPPRATCRFRRRRAQEGRFSKSIITNADTDLRRPMRGACRITASVKAIWRNPGRFGVVSCRIMAPGSRRRDRGRRSFPRSLDAGRPEREGRGRRWQGMGPGACPSGLRRDAGWR